MTIFRFCASKGLTIFSLLFLVFSLVTLKLFDVQTLAVVTCALGLLFLNLLFCFAQNRGFARRTMTLFHLILLLFIFLSGYGSLYYFTGYVELAEGQTEYKGYQKKVMGILHDNRLDELLLVQGTIRTKFLNDRVKEIVSHLDFYKKKTLSPTGKALQSRLS